MDNWQPDHPLKTAMKFMNVKRIILKTRKEWLSDWSAKAGAHWFNRLSPAVSLVKL